MLQANVTPSSKVPVFPPLPYVPEPAIFDPSYAGTLAKVLNDSSFPPKMPVEKIYFTRLKVIEAILASRKESAHSVSINLFFAWVSMVLLCGFLLIRIRRNRQRALLGDTEAARKIVLPAFEPLLWTLGIINFTLIVAYGIVLLTYDVGSYYNRVTIEIAIAVKVFNGVVVVMYMLHPSLSLRTLGRAVGVAFVLSIYSTVVVMLLNTISRPDNQLTCYWILASSRWLLAVYMLYLIVYPPTRASVLSFRLLCLYIIGMVLLLYWMNEAYHRGSPYAARVLGWVIAIYSLILPISIWFVLRADTEHWRGLGKRAVELQDKFRRKNGKMQERVSSQGLHVLIEMHRKYIIDFARLQIREVITDVGTSNGTKATVYRGFLHSRKIPVAIKVYMPTDFTEETVAEFSHEAALCGALTHPNILKFHGLCVCPPNICLVTELCPASLQDIVRARAVRSRQGRIMPARRQQMLIDLGYMIDAARALAYLHSFSPPFVHREIKPSHFLVDYEGTLKLTDFGASRVLSVRGEDVASHRRTTRSGQSQHQSRRQTILEVPNAINHSGFYTAPEVIRARNAGTSFYGEAADVFSLAMTMWDILHPGIPKHPFISTSQTGDAPVYPSDSEIAEALLAGHRPPMTALLHAGFRDLITAAWHADPRKRPTAREVVSTLEAIQDELCASFALEFMEDMNSRTTTHLDGSITFASIQAVNELCVSEFVETQSEAVRLGNMLMDCGFLHHTKHARSFEYTASNYMFDVDQIVASQPLALLESGPDGREVSRGDFESHPSTPLRPKIHPDQRSIGSSAHLYDARGHVDAQSSNVVMERRCACRQLGQRIETDVKTRRRFLLKFKTLSEENLLTAKLLTDDFLPMQAGGDFAAFHEPTDLHAGRTHKVMSDIV